MHDEVLVLVTVEGNYKKNISHLFDRFHHNYGFANTIEPHFCY